MDEKLEDISERTLCYLHQVASRGGIRMAAEFLAINASVVSRQIRALERSLQVPLIEKQGRGVVVTDTGRLLIDFYLDRQHRRRELNVQLQEYRGLQRGRVAIGVGEGYVEGLIGAALQSFSATYPDILIELQSAATLEIVSMVQQDKVDMGLCIYPGHDPTLTVRSVQVGPLCALMHHQHPLATREKLTPVEVSEHRLIYMPDNFGVQQCLKTMFDAENIRVTPSYQCDLFSTAQALAIAGLGIAFMSAGAVQRQFNDTQLVAVPLDHPLARRFSAQLVRRSGRQLSVAANHLWQQIEQTISRFKPARSGKSARSIPTAAARAKSV